MKKIIVFSIVLTLLISLSLINTTAAAGDLVKDKEYKYTTTKPLEYSLAKINDGVLSTRTTLKYDTFTDGAYTKSNDEDYLGMSGAKNFVPVAGSGHNAPILDADGHSWNYIFIDLGAQYDINEITAYFLVLNGPGVKKPENIKAWVSNDALSSIDTAAVTAASVTGKTSFGTLAATQVTQKPSSEYANPDDALEEDGVWKATLKLSSPVKGSMIIVGFQYQDSAHSWIHVNEIEAYGASSGGTESDTSSAAASSQAESAASSAAASSTAANSSKAAVSSQPGTGDAGIYILIAVALASISAGAVVILRKKK